MERGRLEIPIMGSSSSHSLGMDSQGKGRNIMVSKDNGSSLSYSNHRMDFKISDPHNSEINFNSRLTTYLQDSVNNKTINNHTCSRVIDNLLDTVSSHTLSLKPPSHNMLSKELVNPHTSSQILEALVRNSK